jgi:predicted naringenin-chalcone synthase
MASALYTAFKVALLKADIDFDTASLKVALIDETDYTVDTATDDYLSDIPGDAIVGTSAALGSVTTTGGVLDADNAVFTAVTGDGVDAAVLYVDTGVAATSLLIAYIDGLSYTPDGSDVVLSWHASGILAL